uniref:Seroin transcript 1A n=1 Tax=Mamestra brassicae TaxID=55057 RepID=A0A455LAM4_MAMBR|nr:seroin transcript 1A [Mamestra brassicae]
MAFTTLLVTVSMVAIANAGWPHNDNPFPGFAGPMPFVFAYPKIPPHNPYQFGYSSFRHSIPFVDPKKIESYVPGPGETYKGSSIRSSAFSTNYNGKVNQGGSLHMIDNDNGRVKQQHHTFGTPP